MIKSIEKIDAYIAKALDDWQVPGMAVAVVKNGEMVFRKGYGVRTQGTPTPVDEHTMFMLISNTKAFTAAALAILVDEGKVRWDDPVRTHIPYFKMYDRYVSEEMRIRDLLSHRSGLKTFSGELLWYGTNLTAKQVIERVQYLQPRAGSPRMSLGYTNLMYVIAGEIVRVASGMQSWNEFVESRLLRPLEMNRTVTSTRNLNAMDNVAAGHKMTSKEAIPLARCTRQDAGAAGAGMFSSVVDMSKWTTLQLARGKPLRGEALFSEKAHREMWEPHTLMRLGKNYQEWNPSTHFRAHGLGWVMRDYKGRKLLSHYGAHYGMSSRVLLVPEENLAFILLSNSMTTLPIALSNRMLDEYLDGDGLDWSDIMLAEDLASRRDLEERIARATERVAGATTPSLDLDRYAGRYHDKLYGEATIQASEDSLVLQFEANPDLTADLTHLHHDTFLMTFRTEFSTFDKGNLHFLLDDRASVTGFEMNIPCDDLLFHELQFRRVSESE